MNYKKIFYSTIGWVGAFGFLLTYFLNSLHVISAVDVSFHFLNLFSALCLAIRVYSDRNYSNLFLELCFIVIAIYYIATLWN